jgi:citrate lyase subunit beta/citryl-CoA lyase
MTRADHDSLVLRSALFVPGHREDLLPKALAAKPDCLFLDLEDGVPVNWKATARKSVKRMLASNCLDDKIVFVRLNALTTGLLEADLNVVASPVLKGFVIPHVDEASTIRIIEGRVQEIELKLDLPPNYFSLIALIESPQSVFNAAQIAASSERLVALFFGCEDFLAALQGRHNESDMALLTPRALVAMAARSARIEALDAPYVKVHDLDGLRRFAETGRDLGFSGMCALSPRQVPVIHEIYTPSETEIQHARAVIAAAEKSHGEGRGVMIESGAFVSPPTVRAARKLLARAEAIHRFEESR